MMFFIVRIAYYLLVFGLSFLVFSIVLPPVILVLVWLFSGHLKDWDWILDTAIWVASKGLIITPLAACAFAAFECGISRGWWKG